MIPQGRLVPKLRANGTSNFIRLGRGNLDRRQILKLGIRCVHRFSLGTLFDFIFRTWCRGGRGRESHCTPKLSQNFVGVGIRMSVELYPGFETSHRRINLQKYKLVINQPCSSILEQLPYFWDTFPVN